MLDQPKAPNVFANQGRPSFVAGSDPAKKSWAIICTVAFAIFWFSALFLAAELFGQQDLAIWPLILTPVSFAIGTFARIMLGRRST